LSLAIGSLVLIVGGGNIMVQAQEAQQPKKQQTGLV